MDTPSPFNSTRSLNKLYYGAEIRVDPRETTYTIGTAAVAVGKYANQRDEIVFGNPGTTAIIVGFSPGVTATSGIPVAPGGWFSLLWRDDGELVMRDMWAISSLASQTLYVLEAVLSPVN